ncbi:MAG: hypothetical protein ACTHJM_15720 [Marmoricola sp.]
MSVDWPHVPRHRADPTCDRCPRQPEPGSALCAGCADDQYWNDKINSEETK